MPLCLVRNSAVRGGQADLMARADPVEAAVDAAEASKSPRRRNSSRCYAWTGRPAKCCGSRSRARGGAPR